MIRIGYIELGIVMFGQAVAMVMSFMGGMWYGKGKVYSEWNSWLHQRGEAWISELEKRAESHLMDGLDDQSDKVKE